MEIPDKLYFKIGEVAQIVGVKPHVLRYWESEFHEIAPRKSQTNQRRYRRRDVERLLRLKRLLYDEGYTIAGARKKIREWSRSYEGSSDLLARLREELEEILRFLG